MAADRTLEPGGFTHCTFIDIDGVNAETQTTVTASATVLHLQIP